MYIRLYVFVACLPGLMPSFPEHRNKKRPAVIRETQSIPLQPGKKVKLGDAAASPVSTKSPCHVRARVRVGYNHKNTGVFFLLST